MKNFKKNSVMIIFHHAIHQIILFVLIYLNIFIIKVNSTFPLLHSHYLCLLQSLKLLLHYFPLLIH